MLKRWIRHKWVKFTLIGLAATLVALFVPTPAQVSITGEGNLSLQTSVVLAAGEDPIPALAWSGMPTRTHPEFIWSGSEWVLAEDGYFGALLPNSSDGVFSYTAEGGYLNLTVLGLGYDGKNRVGNKNKPLDMSPDGKLGEYIDTYDIDISLEVGISQAHWKKIITFGSADILSFLPAKADTVDLFFQLDTDFNIPDGIYTNKIPLGNNTYIEVAKVWDSAQIPIYDDEEPPNIIGYTNNELPAQIEVKTTGQTTQLIKTFPADWIRAATFPVYTDVDITWGSAVLFTTAATPIYSRIDGDYVDTDLFVIGFRQEDAGKARVGDSSGATVSFGSMSEFCADITVATPSLGLAALGTAKIMAVYPNDAAGDDGFVRAATLSGTPAKTIDSWGTALEFYTSDIDAGIGACGLTTDVAGYTLSWEGGADDMWHGIVTASGTTLTHEDNAETVATRRLIQWAKKLNATHFIVVGPDDGAGVHAQVVEWDSDSMSDGAVAEIFATSEGNFDKCAVAVLAEDKVVIFGSTDKAGGSLGTEGIWAKACDINLTTHAITVNTVYLIDAQNYSVGNYGDYDACKAGDDTHFLIVYRDEDDSDKGKSRYCSVNWATKAITVGDAETMNDAAIGSFSSSSNLICLIDMGTYCVCSYKDDGDANDIGETRKGTYPAGCSENISNTPATKAFGTVSASTYYWSNGTPPTFPLDDGECYFEVTNNSGGAVSITIVATNFTGGDGWTLAGSPGENIVTLKAGKSGDALEANMVTLTTSPQAFISALPDSTAKKWEIKMETPTSYTDPDGKTSILTLSATCD